MDARLQRILAGGRLVVLTGAGISAASGIPTFRGPEGYWRVGSRNYHPQELATAEAFRRMPEVVWAWYRHRWRVCRKAQPNKAHEILVALEREMGERFCLVTQNVDGLHLRAGHEPRLCLQIHGNLDFMRCLAACTTELFEFDDERGFVDGFPRCPHCNAPARPHVLWFDEYYDEQYYRARSAMDAALAAEAMIIIGASGAANLPLQMASCVARRGGLLVDINLEDSELSNIVERAAGMIVRRPAIDALLDIRALQ